MPIITKPLSTGNPVKVNGKIYPSAVDAGRAHGVAASVMYKYLKKLKQSKRSEITEVIKVPIEFTFGKIKP